MSGASGNAGREVVRALKARGVSPRCSNQDGVPRLDFRDPTTWDAALQGVEALFLMRPPPISDMDATLIPFVAAARQHGVDQIVFLSVAGADTARWVPHHKVEQALIGGDGGYTILRPGFFAQNLADAYRDDIRRDDRIYVPAGRGRVAFIDLRDLGEVATMALLDPAAHRAQAYTLTGPQAFTFDEVAQALTEATGRKVDYVAASITGYARHLWRRGLPWGAVAVQTYLHVGLRWGQAETVDDTLAALLGHAPHSVLEYIEDHADLWRPA